MVNFYPCIAVPSARVHRAGNFGRTLSRTHGRTRRAQAAGTERAACSMGHVLVRPHDSQVGTKICGHEHIHDGERHCMQRGADALWFLRVLVAAYVAEKKDSALVKRMLRLGKRLTLGRRSSALSQEPKCGEPVCSSASKVAVDGVCPYQMQGHFHGIRVLVRSQAAGRGGFQECQGQSILPMFANRPAFAACRVQAGEREMLVVRAGKDAGNSPAHH